MNLSVTTAIKAVETHLETCIEGDPTLTVRTAPSTIGGTLVYITFLGSSSDKPWRMTYRVANDKAVSLVRAVHKE